MSKKARIEGYSVIVFVPVHENQPHAAYIVGGAPEPEDAKIIADHIAGEICKHVGPDYIAARRPEIEPQVNTECEYCGYAWHGTNENPDYNGGCCAGDEEDHKARAKSAELSVTAMEG